MIRCEYIAFLRFRMLSWGLFAAPEREFKRKDCFRISFPCVRGFVFLLCQRDGWVWSGVLYRPAVGKVGILVDRIAERPSANSFCRAFSYGRKPSYRMQLPGKAGFLDRSRSCGNPSFSLVPGTVENFRAMSGAERFSVDFVVSLGDSFPLDCRADFLLFRTGSADRKNLFRICADGLSAKYGPYGRIPSSLSYRLVFSPQGRRISL